ncbi:hypothetical protein PMIN06_013176 [Paraphaeosphaeria minitans]
MKHVGEHGGVLVPPSATRPTEWLQSSNEDDFTGRTSPEEVNQKKRIGGAHTPPQPACTPKVSIPLQFALYDQNVLSTVPPSLSKNTEWNSTETSISTGEMTKLRRIP